MRFSVADAADLRGEGEYGQVIANPPYGERLMEKQEAEALYRVLGRTVKQLPPKWRTYILSSHEDFERFFGQRAKKKRKLYNGMIQCNLYQYGG